MNILSNTEDNKKDGTTQPPPKNREGGNRARADAVAVALEYDSGSEFAPKVIAGGRGKIAEQILQIAFERGIKVREDADLAEMLSAIDIDSEIPIEAFAAVAEILVYVYRANDTLPNFLDKKENNFEQNSEDKTPQDSEKKT